MLLLMHVNAFVRQLAFSLCDYTGTITMPNRFTGVKNKNEWSIKGVTHALVIRLYMISSVQMF